MKLLIFVKKLVILLILFFICDFLISVILSNGLKLQSNLNKDSDILINGSSMSGSGFNREEIENMTGKSVSTYIREGISVFDRYTMINHFFSMHPNGVETVIYELNPVLLTDTRTSENVYLHFLPFMDDKNINNYIKRNASLKEYYIHKIIRTTRYESRSILGIVRNYLGLSGNIKNYGLDSLAIKNLLSAKGVDEIIINKASKDIFESTMDTISSHNSNILLVMMPMYFAKLQTYTVDSYEKLCTYFDNYSSSRENIQFLNLNQDSIIFDANNFSDPLHFNVNGQSYLTELISSYLIKYQEN